MSDFLLVTYKIISQTPDVVAGRISPVALNCSDVMLLPSGRDKLFESIDPTLTNEEREKMQWALMAFLKSCDTVIHLEPKVTQ